MQVLGNYKRFWGSDQWSIKIDFLYEQAKNENILFTNLLVDFKNEKTLFVHISINLKSNLIFYFQMYFIKVKYGFFIIYYINYHKNI